MVQHNKKNIYIFLYKLINKCVFIYINNNNILFYFLRFKSYFKFFQKLD